MKLIFVLGLVGLLAAFEVILVRSHALSNSREWAQYKRQFNKSYTNQAEEARRHANFVASKAHIERHNAIANISYKLGLNHLADWHAEDLVKMNGLKYDTNQLVHEMPHEHIEYLLAILDVDNNEVPDEVDWRKVPNRVSVVKDQGDCGSCWAFATTGVLEGQQVPLNLSKKLIPISVQDLVDCSERNRGCLGGYMSLALDDIKTLGGIESDADYPYRADDSKKCSFDRSKSVMTDSGHIILKAGDEDALKRMVAKYGPVSTGIFVTDNLINYKKGVLIDTKCVNDQLNHGILIVGYGTDSLLGDFWIVKNSWGADWGENGFFRVQRGTNMCNITNLPTIPKF